MPTMDLPTMQQRQKEAKTCPVMAWLELCQTGTLGWLLGTQNATSEAPHLCSTHRGHCPRNLDASLEHELSQECPLQPLLWGVHQSSLPRQQWGKRGTLRSAICIPHPRAPACYIYNLPLRAELLAVLFLIGGPLRIACAF